MASTPSRMRGNRHRQTINSDIPHFCCFFLSSFFCFYFFLCCSAVSIPYFRGDVVERSGKGHFTYDVPNRISNGCALKSSGHLLLFIDWQSLNHIQVSNTEKGSETAIATVHQTHDDHGNRRLQRLASRLSAVLGGSTMS